jgi:hypothetical protein
MSKRRPLFPVVKKGAFAITDTSATDVTQEFEIPEGSRLRIDLLITAKPSGGSGTISLYAGDHINPTTGERMYSAVKSVTIDASNPSAVSGVLSITLNPEVVGDVAFLPVSTHGVIKALSSGAAGATFTIASVAVIQER